MDRATEGILRGRSGYRNSVASRITPYRNGPYLIRGEFTILDQDGREVEVARRTVALCRCGASRNKPFCDGTHKAIGFRADDGRDEST